MELYWDYCSELGWYWRWSQRCKYTWIFLGSIFLFQYGIKYRFDIGLLFGYDIGLEVGIKHVPLLGILLGVLTRLEYGIRYGYGLGL